MSTRPDGPAGLERAVRHNPCGRRYALARRRATAYHLPMRTLPSIAFALLLGVTAGQTAPAQPAPHAAPGSTISAERLARIDKVLQQYVDENRIGGAVGLVLQDGKPVYERAVGWADKEAGTKMAPDTIFRIASQTKALTSVGDPLADGGGQDRPDRSGQPLHPVVRQLESRRRATAARVDIVPARRPITIRDLLTHTAGISYGTDAEVAAQYEAKGLGPGRRLRLVHGRQGRADLRDDGAARHAAVRRAAGRGVGLRLQHRHPRLRGREGERHAARRVHPHAHHRPARDEGHAVLPAARAARPPGGGLLERQRRLRSSGRPTARGGRAPTSTARARASPAARDCCPRRATTRGSWR